MVAVPVIARSGFSGAPRRQPLVEDAPVVVLPIRAMTPVRGTGDDHVDTGVLQTGDQVERIALLNPDRTRTCSERGLVVGRRAERRRVEWERDGFGDAHWIGGPLRVFDALILSSVLPPC